MDAHDTNDSQSRTLASTLDPGLAKEAGRERLDRLRQNLVVRDASHAGVDLDHLKLLGANFAKKKLRLSAVLQQYYSATDSGRWPILVFQPKTPDHLRHLERHMVAAGFTVEQSLASAYRKVSLLPIRVPPEPSIIEALALRDDVARIERSWLTGSTPEFAEPNDQPITHPDNLLDRDILPSELLSKRDPLRIGVIDSGIDATHPALKTRLLDQRAFRRGLSSVGDQIGHGTATAGIIARLCTAATFLSAKVYDSNRRTNLDDLIRAVGWLKKHRPDLVICNVLLPMPASGTSVLSSLLASLVAQGVIVIVPALDTMGEITTPGNTPGVISVAPLGAAPATAAMVRASGQHLLSPRGIQAKKDLFVELDYPGWTLFSGPAAAAAITAGTAGLMLRVARMCRHTPAANEIRDSLLLGCTDGVLKPDTAINSYLTKLRGAMPGPMEKATAPVRQTPDQEAAPASQPIFVEEPATVSEDIPAFIKTRGALNTEMTQPLENDTKRALAEARVRLAKKSRFDEEENAPTIQGSIPEHILNMDPSGSPETELPESERPEWWPESEEISIEGIFPDDE